MKRVSILMFIVLVSAGSMYAASSETLVVGETSKDSSVVLYLKPEGSFSYEFGFTSSSSIGDDVNPDAEFTLTPVIGEDGTTVSFSETSNVYVYWNIFGNQAFTLYLRASDGLKSTTKGSTDSIPWVISWTDDGNATHELSGATGNDEKIMEYTVPSGWPIENDHVGLTVSPGSAAVSLPAAEIYQGTLTLTVEVNG